MCGVSIKMQSCSICVQVDKGKVGGETMAQRGNEQEPEQPIKLCCPRESARDLVATKIMQLDNKN
jgi:hypothetical protein